MMHIYFLEAGKEEYLRKNHKAAVKCTDHLLILR